jgi:hypothetical protein
MKNTTFAGVDVEAVQTLTMVAETIFQDYRSNGFSRELALAYNIVVSAAHYLQTGSVMVGGRCEKFFTQDGAL